jgi:hypothetical protein
MTAIESALGSPAPACRHVNPMKTVIALVAVAALLSMGMAQAASTSQTSTTDEPQIYCSYLLQPVCYTYNFYCNYIGFCPIR